MHGIQDVDDLEDRLSAPTEGVIETLGRLEGDLIVLGVAGKMGPTLARMARRAFDQLGSSRRVIGVARFNDASLEHRLRSHGVETIKADLLDEASLAAMPEAPNVVFRAGKKFGTSGGEATTWALNSYLPGLVCGKYRESRIVAFSTGNVYGLVPVSAGAGSRETDTPAPEGEYAMSCLGRERIFEHFSGALAIPMTLIRLNYAVEMRYGVLVDIATRVCDGLPVDLAIGSFNVIWQGDANAIALRALEHVATPPWVVNVTGSERLSVKEVAKTFGRLLGREPLFSGEESPLALLSDASQSVERFGPPVVPIDRVIEWVGDWIARGGSTLGKPTHFEVTDGRF